jgi:hypothetical protein
MGLAREFELAVAPETTSRSKYLAGPKSQLVTLTAAVSYRLIMMIMVWIDLRSRF